jgi:mono/diheme cytochrome c family protein
MPEPISSRLITLLLWLAGVLAVFAAAAPLVNSSAATPPPTFDKDVAPILFAHCVSCHRPGEIGAREPLGSYETARTWAQAIRETVLRRQMPPWTADPKNSLKFRNDPRLTEQEIETLVAWIVAGSPRGNAADLPPPPRFEEGWLHPEGLAPDLVLSLPESQLPAQSEIPYLRYLVKVPVEEDKWIVAMQVVPGNREAVHHMAITELVLPDGVTPKNIDKLDLMARKFGFSGGVNTRYAVTARGNPAVYDLLGVYTPGTTFEMYENGSAKLLKACKNCYLNFNIHYQTTGKPEKDLTKVAFWFQSKAPRHQLFRGSASGETIIADGKQLLTDAPGEKAEGTSVAIPPIPPFAENYEVIGITAYAEPVTIYQFQPHAHLRGKDFKYSVVYPDGREETLLSVPKYDFHWQLAYDLATPLKLPAGSKLIVTAHYDNSARNEQLLHHSHAAQDQEHSPGPHSPGPDKEVHFRDRNQSWDEMFTPFIQYTMDGEDVTATKTELTKTDLTNTGPTEPDPKVQAGIGNPEPREHSVVGVAEVVGCLVPGPAESWMLVKASAAIASDTQTTSLAALTAAANQPLGNQQYQLIGVSVFSPASQQGRKSAVKGVLIKDAHGTRLNVTSLQTVAGACF